MSTLSLKLFGTFTLQRDGQPLPATRTRKEQWLLALLALHAPQPIERSWLAATLWPDSADALAREHLRHSLRNLRIVLGPDAVRLVCGTSRTLGLDVAGMQVDVLAFDAALAQGEPEALEGAVALYGGPLLEGCELAWLLSERQVREQGYCQALETLAEQALKTGTFDKAVSLLRRLLAVDPLRESAVRRLMQALTEQGDPAAMIRVYRDFRFLLHDQMHIQPGAETSGLFRLLQAQVSEKARTLAPRLAPASAPRSRRLPAPATPLIGRHREIEQVLALMERTRLLTLLGSGGVGKTRLAIAVAETVAEEYREGVCFVDLAALQEPERVVPAVASALEVRDEPARPLLETLLDSLQARSLLLILDNCEHLTAACASLTEALLAHCPHLHLLATSRQPLGAMAEQTWRVPSLSLPAASAKAWEQEKEAQAILMGSEAVQLFVERAVLAHPGFRLTRENLGSVADLCRLLEGIPLAIELAAGWVRMLPVGQVVSRLRDRLDLLQSRQSGRLARQQTLWATLDWSYGLLTEQEQRLLSRLSVFVGGWTLEAAEAVCAEEGATPDEVLLGLAGLVDKSLVVYEEQKGIARYRFLETTRQYCQERLSEPERQRLAHRHADFFLKQALTVREEVIATGTARQAPVRMDRENYWAAWHWWEKEDTDTGIAMMLALQLFGLTYANTYSEMKHAWIAAWIERLTTRELPAPSPLQADLYLVVGIWACQVNDSRWHSLLESAYALAEGCQDLRVQAEVHYHLAEREMQEGTYANAQAHYKAAQDCFQRNGNRVPAVAMQQGLAHLAYLQGDVQEAKNLADRTLRAGHELGSALIILHSLDRLGEIAFEEQDYPLARRYLEDALHYCSRQDAPDYANILRELGKIAARQGDFEAARGYLLESITVAQETDDWAHEGLGYASLAEVARQQGDFVLAGEYLTRAIRFFQAWNLPWEQKICLRPFAYLARAQSQSERAAILLGFLEATMRQRDWNLLGSSEPKRRYDAEMAALQAEMPAEAFASAWSRGSVMTLEEAVAYALQGQMDL